MKDKQLLVLLAFGMLVLCGIPGWRGAAAGDRAVLNLLEIRGEETVCYGFDEREELSQLQTTGAGIALLLQGRNAAEELTSLLEKNGAAAVQEGGHGTLRFSKLSPRFAYLLGQPLPINEADGRELTLVPGIGAFLAGNIVEYRRKNGRIEDKTELTAVPGIGTKRADNLSPYITFE